MKRLILSLLALCLSTGAFAQSNALIQQMQNMTPAQREAFGQQMQQHMAAQGQDMMACYQKIDMAEMKKLEAESKAKQAEIEALCAAGQRDKALSTAVSFGMSMQSRPIVKDIQKCGQSFTQNAPWMAYAQASNDSSRKHICDE